MTQHQFDTFEIPDATPTSGESIQPAPAPEVATTKAATAEADPIDEGRRIAEIIQIGNAIDQARLTELERAA